MNQFVKLNNLLHFIIKQQLELGKSITNLIVLLSLMRRIYALNAFLDSIFKLDVVSLNVLQDIRRFKAIVYPLTNNYKQILMNCSPNKRANLLILILELKDGYL